METIRPCADRIIINGSVLTINAEDAIAEAVAIRGNKILAVGSNEEIKAYSGDGTEWIDARGKTVMPGFIDAHLHLAMFGLLDHGILDVTYPKAKSIADIQNMIRAEAARKKPGEWIKIHGYDQNKLTEGRHPTKEDLDAAAPNNPVQCNRCCGHMAVYNSRALELLHLDPSEYAPGEVVFNADGSLHGLLREGAHTRSSAKVEYTDEEFQAGLANANRILLGYGITSAHDAGSHGAPYIRAMQDACKNGTVKVRLRPMVFTMFGKQSQKDIIHTFLCTGLHTGCGNEHFQLGAAKIMVDGSSSGPSCAVIEGYSHDPGNHGIQIWEQEEVNEIILEAHKAGFQVTAHAVGDKAVTIMVNAIENALRLYPRKDHRHRIEHCGLTNPELIARLKALGIIPVSNPAFITINGRDYNRFYGDRVNYLFAMKSYLDSGIITAIGSDSPVTEPNPMNSFYAALNRADCKTGDTVGECQKITVLQMARMFTYNGAYASFEENIKGSLEPGKLADIVILDQDLLTYPSEKIQQVKVRYTLIDGQVVYAAQ